MLARFAIIAALMIGTVGCAEQAKPTPVRAQYLCLSRDLRVGAPLWAIEAQSRFPNAVVIVTHGGTTWDREGRKWALVVDADAFADFCQKAFGGRPVVFASCNADGLDLHVPNTWYARQIVYSPPDCFFGKWRDRKKYPGVGSIEAFVEGGK